MKKINFLLLVFLLIEGTFLFGQNLTTGRQDEIKPFTIAIPVDSNIHYYYDKNTSFEKAKHKNGFNDPDLKPSDLSELRSPLLEPYVHPPEFYIFRSPDGLIIISSGNQYDGTGNLDSTGLLFTGYLESDHVTSRYYLLKQDWGSPGFEFNRACSSLLNMNKEYEMRYKDMMRSYPIDKDQNVILNSFMGLGLLMYDIFKALPVTH